MDNNNHGLSEKTDRPSSRGRLPDGSGGRRPDDPDGNA